MSTELSSSLKLKLTTGVAFSSIFLFILSFAYILPAIIHIPKINILIAKKITILLEQDGKMEEEDFEY